MQLTFVSHFSQSGLVNNTKTQELQMKTEELLVSFTTGNYQHRLKQMIFPNFSWLSDSDPTTVSHHQWHQ